jgi:hypothetical protein
MNLFKSFNSDLGQYMHKAACPSGGMESSNPRHWRGKRLHHHGGGVCWLFVLLWMDSWHHELIVCKNWYKSNLKMRLKRYFLIHVGMHHTRSEQPRRRDWKSLPIKLTWSLGYWRKTWSCDTVFHKTTSLECSGKIIFVKLQLGTDFNISFVTVPIESLVYPLCVIPDSGGDRDIYFVVLPKHNWSWFFGERIIITNNI